MNLQGKVERIVQLRAFGLLDMAALSMLEAFDEVYPSAEKLLPGELPVELRDSCEVHLVEFPNLGFDCTDEAVAWMRTQSLGPIGLEHIIGLTNQFENRCERPIVACKLKQKDKTLFFHDVNVGDGGWRRRLCGSTGAFTPYYLFGATPLCR